MFINFWNAYILLEYIETAKKLIINLQGFNHDRPFLLIEHADFGLVVTVRMHQSLINAK